MKKQINIGIIFMILNFFIFNILKINNLSLLHGVYIKNIPFYIILIYLSINYTYIYFYIVLFFRNIKNHHLLIRKRKSSLIKNIIFKFLIMNILYSLLCNNIHQYIYIVLYSLFIFLITLFFYIISEKIMHLIIILVLIIPILMNDVYNIYFLIIINIVLLIFMFKGGSHEYSYKKLYKRN